MSNIHIIKAKEIHYCYWIVTASSPEEAYDKFEQGEHNNIDYYNEYSHTDEFELLTKYEAEFYLGKDAIEELENEFSTIKCDICEEVFLDNEEQISTNHKEYGSVVLCRSCYNNSEDMVK